MGRKNNEQAETQEEGAPNLREHIGHITTPIDDIGQVKHILESHGVIMIKCQSDDGWLTLILPNDSKTVLKDKNDKYSLCTVVLPDGYSFGYLPPRFSHYGTRGSQKYERFPQIIVQGEKQGE